MSKNFSATWAKKWLPIFILVLVFLALPFQSASAAASLKQHVQVANDQAQLWFAVIAMGSLLLLGVVWILWPERRCYSPKLDT